LGFDAGHEFTHGGAGVVFGQSLAGCEVEPVGGWLTPIPERYRGELPYDRALDEREAGSSGVLQRPATGAGGGKSPADSWQSAPSNSAR
jgi:hypothetical protein